MATLRDRLQTLAHSFANELLNAIRSSSLEELVSESGRPRNAPPSAPTRAANGSAEPSRRSGRLRRRSSQDIAQALERVVKLVRQHKEGLRAEQIRAELKMQSKEMPRVLKEGLAKKQLKTRGQKRATTYFAA